jgi:glutamyl-tRNA synthetase
MTAEELVGVLAWSCGWLERPEPVTPRELLPRFRLDAIPKRLFVWADRPGEPGV